MMAGRAAVILNVIGSIKAQPVSTFKGFTVVNGYVGDIIGETKAEHLEVWTFIRAAPVLRFLLWTRSLQP